jgi:hypothetical protein
LGLVLYEYYIIVFINNKGEIMIIDPTTNLGKVRLRIADVGDLPYLSDSVIQTTLDDNNGNVKLAAKTCAMYILGMLSHKTHRRMNQLEVWGNEAFAAYKEFLMLAHNNPAFLDYSPLPYMSAAEYSPLLDFQRAWNSNFVEGTEAQQLSFNADLSPNDNTRTGMF